MGWGMAARVTSVPAATMTMASLEPDTEVTLSPLPVP